MMVRQALTEQPLRWPVQTSKMGPSVPISMVDPPLQSVPPLTIGDLARTPWGFVIYRTSYTQLSDSLFPQAIAKLRDWVMAEFDSTTFGSASHVSTEDRARFRDSFRNLVIEDEKVLAGIDYTEVGRQFKTFLRAQQLDWFSVECSRRDENLIPLPDRDQYGNAFYQIPALVKAAEEARESDNHEESHRLRKESIWNLTPRLCLVLDEAAIQSLVTEPVTYDYLPAESDKQSQERYSLARITVVLDEADAEERVTDHGWGKMYLQGVHLARLHYTTRESDLCDDLSSYLDRIWTCT